MNTIYPGLENQHALVTGGGGGIGADIAKVLARCGARITVADRDHAAAAHVVETILGRGGDVGAAHLDVTDEKSVCTVFDESAAARGTIGILVAAAGIAVKRPFLEYTIEDWDRTLAVNLRGVFLCCQTAARAMVENTSGAITVISSICGSIADTYSPHVAYEASKGGVNQLVKAMAVELGSQGIRVNAIAPGRILTPLLNNDKNHVRHVCARIPLGHYGQPMDVAETVAFLSSSAAAYITGTIIGVDGGWMAN